MLSMTDKQYNEIHELTFCCECRGINHAVSFYLDDSKTKDPEITIGITLHPAVSFFTRVRNAFMYLFFPTKSRYCYYDEVLLSHAQTMQLLMQLQLYRLLHGFRDQAKRRKRQHAETK